MTKVNTSSRGGRGTQTGATHLSTRIRRRSLVVDRIEAPIDGVAARRSPVDVADVVPTVALQPNGTSTDDTEVRRVATSLRNEHLPTTAAAGGIVDPNRTRVESPPPRDDTAVG